MVAGEKLLELRKSKPRTEGPFRVLVYITGSGCVCGEFICPDITKTTNYEGLEQKSCVSLDQIIKYSNGKPVAVWSVEKVQEFLEPKPLKTYGISRPPQSWQYLQKNVTEDPSL